MLPQIFGKLIPPILLLYAFTAVAQPVTLPRVPSPAASVTQTLGISIVNVNYSRPSVKGRKIWGELVPYGWNRQGFGNGNSAPWRAGANENTVISFSHDALVEGQRVPAGSYGLFFVLNEDNSGEVVLSKDHRSWGSFFYQEGHDQLRAKIKVLDNAMTETLTYGFNDITKNAMMLSLDWEKKRFTVNISYPVDSIVMANAAEELTNATGFTPQGFISAANYALQNKTNEETAIKWIDQALAQGQNFRALMIKAGLLRDRGMTGQADSMTNKAIAVANELELNQYGYQLVAEEKNAAAIKIFKMNTDRFPKSANAWDSLGEGYALAGDKKNAISSFKKSMSLNPPENVRLNSEKYLKQLGAM